MKFQAQGRFYRIVVSVNTNRILIIFVFLNRLFLALKLMGIFGRIIHI